MTAIILATQAAGGNGQPGRPPASEGRVPTYRGTLLPLPLQPSSVCRSPELETARLQPDALAQERKVQALPALPPPRPVPSLALLRLVSLPRPFLRLAF